MKALVLVVTVLCVLACASAGVVVFASTAATTSGASTSIGDAAKVLETHIFGQRFNEYNVNDPDPAFQKVLSYWRQICGGTLCDTVRSGRLQCVSFVLGAFSMAGHPLSQWGNAVDFWNLYQKQPGWERVFSAAATTQAQRGMPAVGDMVVWSGGDYNTVPLANGGSTQVQFGHIAIAINVQVPSGGHDGTLTVAEANAPGTTYADPTHAGKVIVPGYYTMTLHSNGLVDTWQAYTDTHGVSHPGYSVLGYLHSTTASAGGSGGGSTPTVATSDLPAGMSWSTPYVRDAWNDALAYHLPPRYFVAQIQQESGFNPTARSGAGAVGIAQFLPTTAACLAINPVDKHCISVDPWKPVEALQGAAYLMESSYSGYLGDARSSPEALVAYQKALAAYNAGAGAVTNATRSCGASWLHCMPAETQHYVAVILS